MTSLFPLLMYVAGAFVVMIALFNGLFYGAMYMRISSRRLKKIIELGKLKPGMFVYDLGAGYGRIMFAAADTGANVVGYEIDPAKVFWIQQQIKRKLMFNVANIPVNAMVTRDNLLNADLSQADVVYCYLSPVLMQKLGEKAKKEMRPGSALITVQHEIKGLAPAYSDPIDKIFKYQF